jgi:hypothetical protein
MLITVRDRIIKEMEEGKTLEDIIASQLTQGFENKWQAFRRKCSSQLSTMIFLKDEANDF